MAQNLEPYIILANDTRTCKGLQEKYARVSIKSSAKAKTMRFSLFCQKSLSDLRRALTRLCRRSKYNTALLSLLRVTMALTLSYKINSYARCYKTPEEFVCDQCILKDHQNASTNRRNIVKNEHFYIQHMYSLLQYTILQGCKHESKEYTHSLNSIGI